MTPFRAENLKLGGEWCSSLGGVYNVRWGGDMKIDRGNQNLYGVTGEVLGGGKGLIDPDGLWGYWFG